MQLLVNLRVQSEQGKIEQKKTLFTHLTIRILDQYVKSFQCYNKKFEICCHLPIPSLPNEIKLSVLLYCLRFRLKFDIAR